MSFKATAVNSTCECVSVRNFVMITVTRSTVFVRTWRKGDHDHVVGRRLLVRKNRLFETC